MEGFEVRKNVLDKKKRQKIKLRKTKHGKETRSASEVIQISVIKQHIIKATDL